ncbi:MAG TPA: hypothetical protein VGT41_02780 [Candidatus Babeliales bacterium]|nr:hypothetical protein [Candidatus Babeliales bacterium]
MAWQNTLLSFEQNKQWHQAITYMQNVIAEHPNDVDVAIFMNYLLMYVIVYEGMDVIIDEYYQFLAKKYFKESYAKFSENAEYLYFSGRIAVMGQWYFDLEDEEVEDMLAKALQLDKDNQLYQWSFRSDLHLSNLECKYFSKTLIADGSSVRKQLESKGAVGAYLLRMIIESSKTNKERVYTKINEYLLDHIDSKSLCVGFRYYYLQMIEDKEECDLEEKKLFVELFSIADKSLEFREGRSIFIGTPFLELELKQKILEVKEILADQYGKAMAEAFIINSINAG